MSALLGMVDLLKDEHPVLFAKATQPVAPSALRAHEMQPEGIDVRLGLIGFELGTAADALPHGRNVHPPAGACPIFSRLAADMARMGLADDEQRAGESLPVQQPKVRLPAREATPIPHLPGHAGKEL